MHSRVGHFRKALYCFDRALDLQPRHNGALVARSQCHMKLGDAASALKDAEASFDAKESGNIMGLYQYGEALFNLGQFEQALIVYHRGYWTRKDLEEFRVGVNKAQEAIRRAIGDRQATQIEDLDQILPKIDEMNAEMKGPEHCCVLPTLNEKKSVQLSSKKKRALTLARARWVDREILAVLQQDKEYLTKFLKRPDIQGDAQSSSEGLRDNAKEALNYLEIREHFWRQQNPMYARKVGLNFNNDMVLQYEKQERQKLEAARKITMDAAQGAVLKNLSQIEHALKIGRAQDCHLECERALRQIKEVSKRVLPRKPEFMTQILHYKGLAFMKLKNYEASAAAFQEKFKMATDNKMIEIKSRAMDFLGRSYALKGAFAEGAEIWDSRLAVSKTPIERAYLFHEIGRCYYEQHKFDLAKIYASQCVEESLKMADDIWGMNGEILLAQCDIKQRAYDKALIHFEQAEEYGLKCNNKANIQLLREAEQCLKIYIEKKDTQIDLTRKTSEAGSDGNGG